MASVINVRGTHGSGKSTLVHKILHRQQRIHPVHKIGRKRPFCYEVPSTSIGFPVAVLGHYDTPCGGCDSIPKVDEVYEAVQDYHRDGFNVLFEGILAQHSNPKALTLHNLGIPLTVIVLNTPVDTAADRVRARRVERGDLRAFDPKNVYKEAKAVESGARRLKSAGVTVLSLSPEEAEAWISKEFGL